MNTPSYNTLLSKEKLIKTVQELCQVIGKLEASASSHATEEQVEAKEQEINKANQEIYTLKKAVGDLGGSVTYDLPNTLGTSFNTLMNNNGTVKLSEDVTTGRYGPGILAKNHVTLDLNGHTMTFTGLSGSTSAIMARGIQEITIKGRGNINSGESICITCNGKDAVINLTGSALTYQANRPTAELIYCYAGTINITGGIFKNGGSPYLLNCYDANYKNGTAKIIVTGGKFYDFNPADNGAEGEHTSYLAEGYTVTSAVVTEDDGEHTVYTVKKA